MRKLYVVRDVKANEVGDQVMVCKSDAVAVRAFTDALANPQNTMMHKYPEDFELLLAGSMSDEGAIFGEGSFDEAKPLLVLSGAQWKLSQQAAAEAVVA